MTAVGCGCGCGVGWGGGVLDASRQGLHPAGGPSRACRPEDNGSSD